VEARLGGRLLKSQVQVRPLSRGLDSVQPADASLEVAGDDLRNRESHPRLGVHLLQLLVPMRPLLRGAQPSGSPSQQAPKAAKVFQDPGLRPGMSAPEKRQLAGACGMCGAVLRTELTREEADGRVVDIHGEHRSPADAVCNGSARALEFWPDQRVSRPCAAGHLSDALVPEGWMPPEELEMRIQADRCSVPGCSAAVDMRADTFSLWARGAFVCLACGRPSEPHLRRGEALARTICRACGADQGKAPTSFRVAVVASDLVRMRCEQCRATWEEKFPTFRCARCGAAADTLTALGTAWPPPE
jgi:hypothetical protein